MSIRTWSRTPRIRRGLAVSLIALATGGLVLFRSPADARMSGPVSAATPSHTGPNVAQFAGAGAHGSLALSHTKVLSTGEQRIFAELRFVADTSAEARERAPLSLAIVLDTSGSMEGEKIEQAKRSVIQLLRDMRDDDEIAVVRYDTGAELVQGLARVGAVRSSLIERIQAFRAGGGTNIPGGLGEGLRALAESGRGRVRRIVLASDGLDSTRAQAERLASDAAERGITISAMGIGLDFDEQYMGSVARSGRGNFAFVKDASALAAFLHHELDETAQTTIDTATAKLSLPAHLRFVRAIGAEARSSGDGEVSLAMGSLFAGDERRVVIELATQLETGEVRGLEGTVTWKRIGGGASEARVGRLDIAGTTDPHEVEEGRDGEVFASAVSVLASVRQLEAAEAYAKGDRAAADRLIDRNLADLGAAASAAPPAAQPAAMAQMDDYRKAKEAFDTAQPGSAAGKSAAKASAAKDIANTQRRAF